MNKPALFDPKASATWKAVEKAAGLSAKFGGADLAELLGKFQQAFTASQEVSAAGKALAETQSKLPPDQRYSKNENSKAAASRKAFDDSCKLVADTLNKFSVGVTTYKKKVEAKKDVEKDKHKAVMETLAHFIAQINAVAKTSLQRMMQDEAAATAKRKKEEEDFAKANQP